MTTKQREVLDQVEDLLGEHFDAHVIVAHTADVTDSGEHETVGGYRGGQPMAMGLCMTQYERLRSQVVRD